MLKNQTFQSTFVPKYIRLFLKEAFKFAHSNQKMKLSKKWKEENADKYDVLFDLAKCPHFKYAKSKDDILNAPNDKCNCGPESKILAERQSDKELSDLEFYADMKTTRATKISYSIDIKTTKMM